MQNHTLRFENATGGEFASKSQAKWLGRRAASGVLALSPSVGASARASQERAVACVSGGACGRCGTCVSLAYSHLR